MRTGITIDILLGNIVFGWLVLYVLVVSLSRGIFLYSFEHTIISIVLIQVIFPVVLLAPMIRIFPIVLVAPIVRRMHGESYLSYYFLCIGGIIVAQLISMLRYFFEAGEENFTDPISGGNSYLIIFCPDYFIYCVVCRVI